MSNKLSQAREIINKVDKEMAELFEERMKAAKLVAEYKAERGLPIYDEKREEQVIEKNSKYIIDDEIRSIISSAYKKCLEILNTNIKKLHFVAGFLLKNESMDEEQFIAAMTTEEPDLEAIENIAIERQKRSEEENKTAHENNKKEEELRLEREALAREALDLNAKEGPVDLSDAFENTERSDNSDSDNTTDIK